MTWRPRKAARTSIWVLLAFAGTCARRPGPQATATPKPPFSPDCSSQVDCAACLLQGECSWCDSGSVCVHTWLGGLADDEPACAISGTVRGNTASANGLLIGSGESPGLVAAAVCSLTCIVTGGRPTIASDVCCGQFLQSSLQTDISTQGCGPSFTGESCSQQSDCYGGDCINEVCTCHSSGQACRGDLDCCSRNCESVAGGQMGVCTDTCKPLVQPCFTGFPSACCSGVCTPTLGGVNAGLLTEGTCTQAAGMCAPGTQPCGANSDCCSGSCGGAEAGVCDGLGVGAVCGADSDCLSENCHQGSCACQSLNAPCSSSDQCCTLACQGGTCGTPTCSGTGTTGTPSRDCCSGKPYPTGGCYCTAAALPCTQSSDCCSKHCDPTTDLCVCATIGSPCTAGEVCCTGLACPASGICTCISVGPNSLATGCTQNSDCCSNNCVAEVSAAGTTTYSCQAGTTTCQTNSDCDSQICTNGICACSPVGSGCLSGVSHCCSGYCAGQGTLAMPTGYQGTCCAPSCAGKGCGSDGCGGTCPSLCTAGQLCEGNTCVACTPSCVGRACGPNSCGTGSCGTCPAGQVCNSTAVCVSTGCTPSCGAGQTCSSEGTCVSTGCTPSCAGRVCGPNSCGTGSCGVCANGQACMSGTCTTLGGTCPDFTGCMVQYTPPGICSGYIALNNTCGVQAACFYTLSDGTTGCVFLEPGMNSCAFYNATGAAGSIVCVPSSNTACEAFIGCGG